MVRAALRWSEKNANAFVKQLKRHGVAADIAEQAMGAVHNKLDAGDDVSKGFPLVVNDVAVILGWSDDRVHNAIVAPITDEWRTK